MYCILKRQFHCTRKHLPESTNVHLLPIYFIAGTKLYSSPSFRLYLHPTQLLFPIATRRHQYVYFSSITVGDVMDSCNACKAEIRPEDIVVSCDMLCESRHCFHAKCVGLTYDEGCACLHRNIFWMCDSCRNFIETGRFRTSVKDGENVEYATRNELNFLKSEVERICKIMSQTEKNCEAVIDTSASSSQRHHNYIAKHSTPVTSSLMHENDLAANRSVRIEHCNRRDRK